MEIFKKISNLLKKIEITFKRQQRVENKLKERKIEEDLRYLFDE